MARDERMPIPYVAGVLLVIGATESACLNAQDAVLLANIWDVQLATLEMPRLREDEHLRGHLPSLRHSGSPS